MRSFFLVLWNYKLYINVKDDCIVTWFNLTVCTFWQVCASLGCRVPGCQQTGEPPAVRSCFFFPLFTCASPAGGFAPIAKDTCSKNSYFITAALRTIPSFSLDSYSVSLKKRINGENNEIHQYSPRGQHQDGHLYFYWFAVQPEERLHLLLPLMKAFFWQKLRATWGQELDCCICSSLRSDLNYLIDIIIPLISRWSCSSTLLTTWCVSCWESLSQYGSPYFLSSLLYPPSLGCPLASDVFTWKHC